MVGLGLDANQVRARQKRLQDAVMFVGPHLLVSDIRTADIEAAIKKRKARLVRGKKVAANATINRDIIDTIRPVILRARELLEEVPVKRINWKMLRLKEAEPLPHEIKYVDLVKVSEAVAPYWRDFQELQAAYAFRASELFFPPSAIDIERRRIVIGRTKNGKPKVKVIRPEHIPMLAARKSRAEAAGLDTIWFRQLAGGRIKALAYSTAIKAFSAGMTKSGLRAKQGAKGTHDLRRHAAMLSLRVSKNLAATQKLLGHSTLQMTQVYARVMDDDLDDVMEAMSQAIHKQQIANEEKLKENGDLPEAATGT
jgi:integrase